MTSRPYRCLFFLYYCTLSYFIYNKLLSVGRSVRYPCAHNRFRIARCHHFFHYCPITRRQPIMLHNMKTGNRESTMEIHNAPEVSWIVYILAFFRTLWRQNSHKILPLRHAFWEDWIALKLSILIDQTIQLYTKSLQSCHVIMDKLMERDERSHHIMSKL